MTILVFENLTLRRDVGHYTARRTCSRSQPLARHAEGRRRRPPGSCAPRGAHAPRGRGEPEGAPVRQHPRDDRRHAHRQNQPPRARGRDDVRQGGVLQPVLVREGSVRARARSNTRAFLRFPADRRRIGPAPPARSTRSEPHAMNSRRSFPFCAFPAHAYSAKSAREPKTRRFHLRGRLDERRRAATRTGLEHASKPYASSTFFHHAHTKDTELTERARHSVFPTRTRVRATVWLSP